MLVLNNYSVGINKRILFFFGIIYIQIFEIFSWTENLELIFIVVYYFVLRYTHISMFFYSALKLVHLFSINPHLGPLQISLGRMVIDIVKFFFIYSLVLFAFACGEFITYGTLFGCLLSPTSYLLNLLTYLDLGQFVFERVFRSIFALTNGRINNYQLGTITN